MVSISGAGTNIHYTKAGQGPGLVLLHGTAGDGHSTFGPLIHRFTDRRTVLVPDYAGCGHSTLPEGDLSLELLVEQIAAVIRDANLGPVDLLGSSLGAQVAAATAAMYPSLVRRLILIGGHADSESGRHFLIFDTWARLEALDPALSYRYLFSLVFHPEFLHQYQREQFLPLLDRHPLPHMKKRIELSLRMDLRPLLPRIVVPTLVVGMTQDYMIPACLSRNLHTSIKNSRYVEIDCGHAVLREKPEVIVALTQEFLWGDEEASKTY